MRISQAARARAAQVEAQELAAQRARSKRRARALAQVYARIEDLQALEASRERELAAVRARYAERAVVVSAARDAALLDLADLGRAAPAIAASAGMSVRDVNRALAAARRAREPDRDATVDGTGGTVPDPGDGAPPGPGPDPTPQADLGTSPAPGAPAGQAGSGVRGGRVVSLADRRPPAAPDPAAPRSRGLPPVAVGEHEPLRGPAAARDTKERPWPTAGTGSGAGEQDGALF